MQTVQNTLSLTKIPWWAKFFPEYALQPKQTEDAVVKKIISVDERNLVVSASIPIQLFHENKKCLVEVSMQKIGTFTVVVPEKQFENIHEGDHIAVDLIVSRFFKLNRHIAAAIH